ncbi:DNA internalization-related competence protein ComEC/Rec2 [Marichromatium bheemlicum]|uniref:DNA internalization-related competence protein ComEC/Rec2 n=1 Tax=Marichromatium bheemlicum TaxID=365339 RepID=A0ABX1I7E9_9GAMM|nr:DNA internalization-related competence protein ComEC/Rec2 [Marichromatium bheemlicum]
MLIGAALAFVLGVVGVLVLPVLPPPGWLVASALVLLPGWRRRSVRMAGAALLGVCWSWWSLAALVCHPFPDTLARVPLVVEGRIETRPVRRGQATRFLFRVEHARHGGETIAFTGRVRLSWYRDAPVLHPGERWRLPVRLKPVHGYANPGGFDYERWLFVRQVVATGNLRAGEPAQLLDPGPGGYWLARLRQRLGDHLATVLGDAPALGAVQALTLGVRDALTSRDWEILTRTGTNHLLAISGLHVAVIAGAVFALGRWLWSRSRRLTLWLAAPRAGAVMATGAALGYAGLAGFAISTQRALIMIAVVLGALFWLRVLRPWQGFVLALAGVVALDPLAPLGVGFWLSFGAVAAILLALAGRLPSRTPWRRWGQVQWAVSIGLLPLLLLLFARASLVAPLVNLVAVPLFSLLLPLLLVAAVLSLLPGLEAPLRAVAWLLEQGLVGLGWVADQPWSAVTLASRPSWVWLAAILGVALLLAPRGLPGRWLGLVGLAALVLVRPLSPPSGALWLTLVDVGQGLAVVARTHEHTLVYDTGPGFASGFETGSAVLVPLLRAQGVERVDRLVVSHADRDHAGGLVGLRRGVEVRRIDSGEPAALGLDGVGRCRAGEGWVWSGVRFRFLHPVTGGGSGNDASCVLRIEVGDVSVLLTGDIGAAVERQLVERHGAALRSTVLVLAHHGSASSSSATLLEAVAPELALVASGYANHYGFPAEVVCARLIARDIETRGTAHEGALRLRLEAEGVALEPGWRARHDRLWRHRPDAGCAPRCPWACGRARTLAAWFVPLPAPLTAPTCRERTPTISRTD